VGASRSNDQCLAPLKILHIVIDSEIVV